MTMPQEPTNPRVVYPDGHVIPIRKVWYGTRIHDTHVWVADDPQFVPWVPGAHTEFDSTNPPEQHFVIVGFDMDVT